MYKVIHNGNIFCDSRIEELAIIEPVVSLEENTAGTFTFMIVPDHPMYDDLRECLSYIQVYRDDETLPTFAGVVKEVETDFWNRKKVYCEGALTYLNDSIQRQAVYQGQTVRGLLEAYIASHNSQVESAKQFKVGVVTIEDNNDSLYRYTNMNSTLQELKEDIIDDLGGILRVRYENETNYLDALKESPYVNSQEIKLGENLLDFTSNLDSSEVATVVIPLGARLEDTVEVQGLDKRLDIKSVNGGKDYLESAEAIANFGRISKVVTWDDVTTADALKRKGQLYLSDSQFANMVIEASAVDLHLIDNTVDQFHLSDDIRVVSRPHGLDRRFRLTKMTINLNNPANDTVTLGKNERSTISAKTASADSDILKAIESITPVSKMLQLAKDNATQLITSAMGGYIYKTNSELYIMDTDNPETAQKVWRWNINGLGYSSTGINGEYGIAMTMDGSFVADFVNAGTMSANRLKGGELVLGGDGNEFGSLIVKDKTGKVVGKWTSDGLTMPSDTKIAWGNVEGAPTIPTSEQITQISKNAVTAETIEGTTFVGKKFTAGTVVIIVDEMGVTPIKVVYKNENGYSCNIRPTAFYATAPDDRGWATAVGIFGSAVNSRSGTRMGDIELYYLQEGDNSPYRYGYWGYDRINGGNNPVFRSWTDCYSYSWGSLSDKRVKDNIESLDIKKSSDFIYSLNPCEYTMKDGSRKHHGFIAQEVAESMSEDWGVYYEEAHNQEEKGYCGLRYQELIADLVATVQSQNERIKELENKVKEITNG